MNEKIYQNIKNHNSVKKKDKKNSEAYLYKYIELREHDR